MSLKDKAQALLDELLEVGPADLPEWIVRAQALLVFEAARKECTEQKGGE